MIENTNKSDCLQRDSANTKGMQEYQGHLI